MLELTEEVGDVLGCDKQTSLDQIVLSCVLDGEEEQVAELFTLTTTVSCLATGLSSPDPLTHSSELSIFVSDTLPIVLIVSHCSSFVCIHIAMVNLTPKY